MTAQVIVAQGVGHYDDDVHGSPPKKVAEC